LIGKGINLLETNWVCRTMIGKWSIISSGGYNIYSTEWTETG